MVHTTKDSLRTALEATIQNSGSVGFVPTMGALHYGHLQLVRQALDANDVVVVSIFVNPTQFDNAGDLNKYPRTLEADVDMLRTLNPNLLVFAPSADHLYNGKVVSTPYFFGGLEFEMEGKHRQGHFDGVGTVLNLLFRAVQPTRAYFGEKDFQQLQIVRKLVRIEKLPIEIVGCPIVREKSGLAMSSRNKRLSAQQQEAAAFIYATLQEVAARFDTYSIPALNRYFTAQFQGHPHLKLEYFEIANTQTLKTAKRKHPGNTYRGFTAVFAGEVRLIDNIALN